tara:strand:+ start:147 stop:350 length:204 start_codon:yes stop_codon:yes gene_type:complete
MLNKKVSKNMLNEIVIYMKDEQIEINETNYKLELLNFIAEHTLNDLDNRKYIDEAVRIYREEHYENS